MSSTWARTLQQLGPGAATLAAAQLLSSGPDPDGGGLQALAPAAWPALAPAPAPAAPGTAPAL